MKTALVTGATGFLGRSACRRLAEAGWKVFPTGHAQDLTLPPPWAWLPERADAVIHLALGRGGEMRPVAVDATRHLLEWSRSHGVRAFALGSSQNASEPVDDYSRAKREAARLVLGSGLPRTISFRLHTLFGEGQNPERLIPRLEETLKSGQPVEVAAPDGVRLAPTHVEDAAEAVIRTLEHPGFSGILPVVGPETLTVGEIARRLAKSLGLEARVVPRPLKPGERDLVGDPSMTETLLGWRPARRFP